MISGVRVMPASGAMGWTTPWEENTTGKTAFTGAELPFEIFQFQIGDTSSPTRLGFFGPLKAPTSPVIVGQYQDFTHITNHFGQDLGECINVKFTALSTTGAEVSGVPLTDTGDTINTIPRESGTLLLRFREPSDVAVATQNGTFRAVQMVAPTGLNGEASGVRDISDDPANIIIRAAELPNTLGGTGDTGWTTIADGTGAGSNSLTLDDQSPTLNLHDFHVIISASPQAAGVNREFGFVVNFEYL